MRKEEGRQRRRVEWERSERAWGERDRDSERERRKKEPQIPKNNLVKACLKARSNDKASVSGKFQVNF